jgi:hypothetical protein
LRERGFIVFAGALNIQDRVTGGTTTLPCQFRAELAGSAELDVIGNQFLVCRVRATFDDNIVRLQLKPVTDAIGNATGEQGSAPDGSCGEPENRHSDRSNASDRKAFWGALIGMIFLIPLAGAAISAASGALGGALTDVGINDQFMKDAAQHLQSGNAALFLLIRKMTADKVLAALQGEGGTVIRTSFDESKEEALRTALTSAAPTAAAPAG